MRNDCGYSFHMGCSTLGGCGPCEIPVKQHRVPICSFCVLPGLGSGGGMEASKEGRGSGVAGEGSGESGGMWWVVVLESIAQFNLQKLSKHKE